jgi:hypothetical protein
MKAKTKKNKIVIKGFIPVGISRDVDYYFSRTQGKFVDSVEKLFVGDLYNKKKEIDPEKLKVDFPLIDSFKGIAKIKLTIKL